MNNSPIVQTGVVLMFSLAVAACGGGGGTDMAKSGTDMAQSGTDMTKTNSADMTESSSCFPSCLTSVINECPLVAPCTQQVSGNMVSVCAPGNVVSTTIGNPMAMSSTTTVSKNGTTCYTSTTGANGTTSYYMPNVMTAFATISYSGSTATVVCGGKTSTVNVAMAGCEPPGAYPSCSMGTCP